MISTEEITKVKRERKTKPKFSEAMRLGSLVTDQGYGEYYIDGGENERPEACAIGAAGYAVGYISTNDEWDNSRFLKRIRGGAKTYQVLAGTQRFECPEPSCTSAKLGGFNMIIHLNDDHHWQRDKIADFIEGFGC